jgi:integrase
MAGHITPRGERTWQVRIFLGYDPETGKRLNHNKTVHGSKKDAQQYLNKVLREKDTSTFVEPTRQTVKAFLNQWLDTTAKARLRARTLDDYRGIANRYLIPALGTRPLGKLTPADIQALYTKMQEPKPDGMELSARTVRYAHAVLHTALEQAVRWRLLGHNPAKVVDLPRQARREMQALTPAEATRFLDAAKANRWHALWVLLVTTGLRPGEALGLKWDDLDGGTIQVQRVVVERTGKGWALEEPKTSRSRRTVSLPASTVRALHSHRAKQAEAKLAAGPEYEDRGLIFATSTGAPERQSNLFRRHFKPLLKAAGLPNVRMYDLRHTAATLLLAAGENPKIVSERLGHSTITLTMDTYSHVLPEMRQQTAERLEGMLFGTP